MVMNIDLQVNRAKLSYFDPTEWIVSRLHSTAEAPNMTVALGWKDKNNSKGTWACQGGSWRVSAREKEAWWIVDVNVRKQILLSLLVQSLS